MKKTLPIAVAVTALVIVGAALQRHFATDPLTFQNYATWMIAAVVITLFFATRIWRKQKAETEKWQAKCHKLEKNYQQLVEELTETRDHLIEAKNNDFDQLFQKLDSDSQKNWSDIEPGSLSAANRLRDKWRIAEVRADALQNERDEALDRFRRLFGKIERDQTLQWERLEDRTLGLAAPLRDSLHAAKQKRDEAEERFEKLLAKIETAYTRKWESLPEQSLGMVEPIRKELEDVHRVLKNRTEELILANDHVDHLIQERESTVTRDARLHA